MTEKTEVGLFDVLEDELKKSHPEPLDCATLFERQSVRDHAATVNRVSDYLGNMWRKGLVLRVPAPKLEGTKARWMYMGPKKRPAPDMSKAVAFDHALDNILSKPGLDISDDGRTLMINLPELVITIQRKPN
jgi:hypothetical protein